MPNSLLYARRFQINFILDRGHVLLVFNNLLLIFLLTFESDHIVGFELELVEELLLGGSQASLQILVQGEGDLVLDVLPNYIVAVVLNIFLGGLNWLQVILTVLRQFRLGRIRLPLIFRRPVRMLFGTFFVFL